MKNYLLLLLLFALAASCRERTDLQKDGEREGKQTQTEQLHIRIQESINSRRLREGIAYLDSMSQIPSVWQECRMELLVGKARLYQLLGEGKTAVRYADEYMQLPECADAQRFITYCEAISGVYMYSSNDISKAIRILERAVEVYRNGGRHPHMLRIISRLGSYYHAQGQYEKASATIQEAITSYNDNLPPQDVVIAYGEQANLYAELGLYQQALQQNAVALHYSLLKDSFGLGDLYRYRANIFMKTGEKDSVFHYLRLGELTSVGMRSFRGVLVNRIEMVHAYLAYPDSLQRAITLGYSLCPDTARIPRWAKSQLELYLGEALWKSGRTAEAVPLLEKASQGFASMNMAEMEAEANKILMDHFRRQGMLDAFMRYYDRTRVFSDSLRVDDNLKAVAAATIRFDTEQKAKENELLSARVALQKRQLFYNVYISVTLALILIGSIIYTINRRKANHRLIEHSKLEIQQLISSQQKLNRNNELLTEQIQQLTASNNLTSIHQLTCQSLLSKEDEILFRQSFAVIHPLYLPRLRKHYPQLTRNEELLSMLICLGQSTDEIALVMGINRSSVNVMRSRMRKNMNLAKEDSLDETVKQFLSQG